MRDFYDVITCNGTIEREIVKSFLIKILFQMDRSMFLDLSGVKKKIIHYLQLEMERRLEKLKLLGGL